MQEKQTNIKYIFINTQGVLTNEEFYKGNLQAWQNKKLSESLVKLLKNVVTDYNVKLVFLESWIESELVLIEKLKEAGFLKIEDFYHSMIKVPVEINSKVENSKSDFIYGLTRGKDNYVILDNNTQLNKYTSEHRKKGIFTNIALGLISGDLLKLREVIEK